METFFNLVLELTTKAQQRDLSILAEVAVEAALEVRAIRLQEAQV
jgi:hypothetical protein